MCIASQRCSTLCVFVSLLSCSCCSQSNQLSQRKRDLKLIPWLYGRIDHNLLQDPVNLISTPPCLPSPREMRIASSPSSLPDWSGGPEGTRDPNLWPGRTMQITVLCWGWAGILCPGLASENGGEGRICQAAFKMVAVSKDLRYEGRIH
ncbi:hypothetical protein RRG08_063484 [Elysia crispata]|uniref:Secreted protein n=1 Tax=Elysia crispata TaxID=231223 RepID=A0AAE1DW82_9GAST|nr:hypothetical protein RRG08_063484 [Elysia crispata]